MTTSLIVYCCVGESYASLLELSLRSLVEHGRYLGRVLVITDLDRSVTFRTCPSLNELDTTHVRIRASDPIAGKLARYRMHRYADLSEAGPILYVDCDIIFDRPVAPMLEAVAAANTICFPSEPDSVAMWSSMGGNFFRAEGIDVGGCGFNSGAMGIPDGSFQHQFTLQMIGSVALETWTQNRPLFEQWVDQPIVNYLQAKHHLFDVDLLTPFFRYNFQHGVTSTSVRERTGAVHFFDDAKEVRMGDYLNKISWARRTTHRKSVERHHGGAA